jgi:hypothetical protein
MFACGRVFSMRDARFGRLTSLQAWFLLIMVGNPSPHSAVHVGRYHYAFLFPVLLSRAAASFTVSGPWARRG